MSNNNFFETGIIKTSIYERLDADEKEKVDSILSSLEGLPVFTVNDIIAAVKEKIPEKSVLRNNVTLP